MVISVIFLIICFLLIFFAKKQALDTVTSFFSHLLYPLQKTTFQTSQNLGSLTSNGKLNLLNEENIVLLQKLADKKKLEEENNALRDQFQTVSLKSRQLIEATIVGAPSFIPNVTVPEQFVIDRGEKDGIEKGEIVVYKDNLVGKIIKTESSLSLVEIIGNSSLSFPAKSMDSGALGVIRGDSGNLLFDNVLLSDSLKKDDFVLTKGEIDLQGLGFSPNLVVGKITSIEKNPSSLFQKARVKSLLDFTKLRMVFVMIKAK